MQALLHEGDTQTQQMMAKQLHVTQQVTSDHLRPMRQIQKDEKWVPYELNERQMKSEKPQAK